MLDESQSMDTSEVPEKKKVCLYTVASEAAINRTDEFMNQQLAIIQLINNTPGWQYEKIYMDIIGEHTAFAEMISECENGSYDIIVTKSILRFAGTIADTLKIAERLASMQPPVEIIFTDEALFSLDREKMNELRERFGMNRK